MNVIIQMKSWMLATILAIAWVSGMKAQTAEDTVYVFFEDQPDAGYFLPAPPDTASLEFNDDVLQWLWGKSVRQTERGRQASKDSDWRLVVMLKMAAEVLELDTISQEETPALYRLLYKTYNTASKATTAAKEKYKRKRPFAQMNEHMWGEFDAPNEAYYRTNGSYPSGHTTSGWSTALVLAEMWPELQDTILRRGFQFGESRIIVGAHWQSDVTAGYLCAAASVARMHANGDWLRQDILAARAEYARLKGRPENYDPVSTADVPHGEKILGTPVDTASYRYTTDIARYWSAKQLRYTERGMKAAQEAEYSVEMMHHVFGEAMGINISEETTPAICALIAYVLEKSSETVDRLKVIRFRKRPFVQLGESSFVEGDEEKERGKSSFPSGHTSLGWTEALTMVEVAPDCQNEILRRGYEYGYNRLIVGYHWFTDIEATRQLACGLIARLHAEAEFCEMIRKARAEYEQCKTGIHAVNSRQLPANSAVYDLQGRRVSDSGLTNSPLEKGIYIESGRKVVGGY